MREIDGTDGGGQVVRTAVSLSAITGEAVRIENVRDGRPTPGMRPQHLAAVQAVSALCNGRLEGHEPESETLVFEPGEVRGGDVSVEIGTAGSIALVFDTLLPLSTALEEPATVTVTGGTDAAWSPPIAYLRRVKLPLLVAAGLRADLSVDSRGFYPLGGGQATLSLSPSTLSALEYVDRGPLRRVEIHSLAHTDLEDADVAERQAAAAAENLSVETPVATGATYAEADCPGSSVVVVAVYEESRAGFSALGAPGRPSEEVANDAVVGFQQFHESSAAVDRHLADQLMVFLAVAGGSVLAPESTDHVETNRRVIETFGYELSVEKRDDNVLLSG
jgi:RNA 3'-terminal phosphate cyclase (ATP)